MNIAALLADVNFPFLEEGFQIGLNWLGKFVQVIIESVGAIGVGIIVFTLILKAITLPFDVYQRIKMRKQTLIMQGMQSDLEKLQKQYANDKNMYNQKMMELYKKNGYSMLGACLPMIISLVILIVAFSAFNAYSQYANLSMYENMASSYNSAVLEYSVDGVDYRLKRDGDSVVTDGDKLIFVWTEDGEQRELSVAWEDNAELPVESDNIAYYMSKISNARYLTVREKGGNTKFVYYYYSLETASPMREYLLDTEKLTNGTQFHYLNRAGEQVSLTDAIAKEMEAGTSAQDACYRCVSAIGAAAAARTYDQNPPSFLWVKNVWYADVSYYHPIQDYEAFVKSISSNEIVLRSGEKKTVDAVIDEISYTRLTADLTGEKESPNGYFILIILSIGLMVLSQFISLLSQKAMNKYQTVNGSGGRSQKLMMIIMPAIYAIFAFMYSAAFSIYMTMSSLIGILVTLGSNFVIGRVFRKKEETAIKEKYSRTLPWRTNENNKDKKKSDKKKSDDRNKTKK